MSKRERKLIGISLTTFALFTATAVIFLALSDDSRSKRATASVDQTPSASIPKDLKQLKTWDDLRQQVAEVAVSQLLIPLDDLDAVKTTTRVRRPARRRTMSADRNAERSFSGAKSSAQAKNAPAGPSSHTGTNNQVSGVEEADIVQTDGRHIYTVHGRELVIVRSWPANQTAVVARYRLSTNAIPKELFVNGNKLVLLSQVYGTGPSTTVHRRRYRGHRRPHRRVLNTRVSVLDVSTRSNPRLIRQLDIDGTLKQARMIGTRVYVVSAAPMTIPVSAFNTLSPSDLRLPNLNPNDQALHKVRMAIYRQRLAQKIKKSLDQKALQNMIPKVRTVDSTGQLLNQQVLHRPQDLYVPSAGAQLGFLSITQMDLNGTALRSAGLMATGSHIYASRDSLYVAEQPRPRWRGRWQGANTTRTRIHKFSLSGKESAVTYAASGSVPGWLLNQFSMDEHKGHLRVATTDRGHQGRTGNNIFVLRQQRDALNVVGSVQGLAKGERIYSARMLGDEGYIVTFRRTDPLFTLDLSNPERPRVMGELKINGYFSYMHPLGNKHLLTIGRDATSTGRLQGVHLQIFDVSDLTNPIRTAHYRMNLGAGYSRSIAESNHHAFTYDPQSKVLAFPINLVDYRERSNSFTGLALFTADAQKGLKPIGRLGHAALLEKRFGRGEPCVITAAGHCAPRPARQQRFNDYRTRIQRSLFIDGYVYSISKLGLMVHQITNLDREVATVPFSG